MSNCSDDVITWTRGPAERVVDAAHHARLAHRQGTAGPRICVRINRIGLTREVSAGGKLDE